MTSPVPVSHRLRSPEPVPPLDLDWPAALEQIASTETYLIATVRPDSTPHVVPVLGVFVDDHLTFNTAPQAHKARNLASNPAITVAAPGADYDFTLEGTAYPVTDGDALRRAAAAYPRKYPWWHPQVRNGQFYAGESSQPRRIIAVHAHAVFGFGKAAGFSATKWTFT